MDQSDCRILGKCIINIIIPIIIEVLDNVIRITEVGITEDPLYFPICNTCTIITSSSFVLI